MSLVLVPSVLHEAFGMVVVDAMLQGLPVLASEAGALPEAAAGAAAAVLPVEMVRFPPDADSSSSTGQQHEMQAWLAGQRSWGRREYGQQEQHVQAWADAVSGLLSDREAYVSAGQRGRRAAMVAMADGEQQLQQLVAWLRGLKGGLQLYTLGEA
jgi:glycosyltransferase involved in cell wall biosynthesis